MKKLSFLLISGISFTECLYFLIKKEKKSQKKLYLQKALSRIHAGLPIHKSFDTQPFIIDKTSLRIIKNAEATGTLSKSCQRLGLLLEEELLNKNRLVGALLYPICIIIFALVLILSLLFFIFPKIIPLLQSSGVPLPLSTQLLLLGTSSLGKYGVRMLIVSLSFIVVGVVIFKKSFVFQKFIHKSLLCIPFFSSVFRFSKLSTLAKEISLFLESGHSVVEALSSATEYEVNLVYKECLSLVTEEVKKGIKFSKSLENNPLLFGSDLPLFVSLGEESGGLSKSLLQVSAFYDEELKNIEKKLFALLEPTLMLVLGGIVGFIALSLVTPIYSITSSLNTSKI